MRHLSLALLAGLMYALAFPTYAIWPLAWIWAVPLLIVMGEVRGKPLFLYGMITGTVAWAGIVYWIAYVMNLYGGMGLFAAAFLLLLLLLFLSLYFGGFAWLAGRFTGTRAAFVAIPGAWLALELLRSCFPFGGFPWALLGYSQFPLASFIQIAEFGGVYLIGGLVMMANVAIYTAVKDRKYLPALVCAVLVAMGSAWGHYRMGTLPEGGEKLRAAVCQASIPQEMKWDLEQINPTIDIYERLTREAVKQGARIAVWPETACPFFLFQQWPYSNRIIDLSRSTGIRIVTGSPSYDDGRYLNRVWLLEDGKIGGYYDKVHLVPFGEYLPLAGLIRPFFSGLTEEIGNFSTTQQEAYPIGDMGVLICFEIVFPGMARDLCNRGAAYLINASNDAWFKTWSTPRQHLEMACFRSIETRRWLLSAVNHGISAVVSPEGRIVESIGLLREGFIVHDITLSDRSTFYTRFGPIIACLWAGFSLIAALTRRKARC